MSRLAREGRPVMMPDGGYTLFVVHVPGMLPPVLVYDDHREE